MGNYQLQRFPDAMSLAQQAAADFLAEVSRAPSASKDYCIALAGGRIARDFFLALAQQATKSGPDLQSVHFFWSDERCVPPGDPESNFRLAWDNLLKPLRIPDVQIHRIIGEAKPEEGAARAERDLRSHSTSQKENQPVVDLVLLGLGENGHVASLFPAEPIELAKDPAVFRSVVATKPPPRRITMGYRTLAAAARVWVLASGAGKEQALADSLEPGERTPLGRVLAMRTTTRIFTDIQL